MAGTDRRNFLLAAPASLGGLLTFRSVVRVAAHGGATASFAVAAGLCLAASAVLAASPAVRVLRLEPA